MSTQPVSLTAFDTFGDVAAEDDAVLDYFLSTKAVEKVETNKAFLVLGRKGTGKTAIVRYLTEGAKSKLSRSLSLRGYPWSVHAARVDHGASDIEAYVSSWRYLIAVELSALVLSHADSWKSLHFPPVETISRRQLWGQRPSPRRHSSSQKAEDR